VDKRLKSLVSAIEAAGVLADIGHQQPRDLLQWVHVECKRRNLSIDPDAAQSLIDRCDGSMTVLWQEMTKLFLYCAYAKVAQIDLALVDLLSLPDLRGTIFDLTDALSAGQAGRALQLADTLISQKTPVQLIQFMLARHVRQLICAAELGLPEKIASELKVMPFVASRLAGQARKMPLTTLEDLYGRCFEMDVSIKSGRIGDRLALETLLVTAAEQLKR
jgi:DNA polymerase-3 subunit delta